MLESKLKQDTRIEKRHIFAYSRLLGPEYLYALLIQLVQSAAADAAYYNGIYLFIVEGHNGVARSVLMVLIAVAQTLYAA